MVFGKGFRSKMGKVFSSSPQDPDVVNDPPPPYTLPPEFTQVGIKEDDLEILRDYDTVIIVDDSGSMEPLWNQVIPTFPPGSRSDRSLILAISRCRRAGHWRHSQSSLPDTIETELTYIFSITTSLGNI